MCPLPRLESHTCPLWGRLHTPTLYPEVSFPPLGFPASLVLVLSLLLGSLTGKTHTFRAGVNKFPVS